MQCNLSNRRLARALTEALEGRRLLSGLAITYDSNGISTLAYNGDVLTNVPTRGAAEGFQVNRYYTLNTDGTYAAIYGGAAYSSNWNASTHTLTYIYPAFGSITVQYVQPTPDRLNMIFTVTNRANSNVTLGGVDIYPASLHFPNPIQTSAPGQWFPMVDAGVDGPNVIPANYTSGTSGASAAFVNDSDVTKPIYTSLYTIGTPNGKDYFMWVGTGPKDSQASTLPIFHRNTAPGQTDTFEESLRFGPAGTDPISLASDVEQAYAAAYPNIVNWPDRRAIGSLHLTSPPTHPNNPEGWFNNSSTTNTTTIAGLNQFGADLLSYANTSVSVMKADNAQGMIVWDLEGQRWPQATTYIGDPRLLSDTRIQANSEMLYNYDGNGALVDQFFAIFRNAGFRTGLTIRPTQILYQSDGTAYQASNYPDGTLVDEVAELEGKIAYANQRWGCTLFYLDSNSGYDRDAIRTVQAAYPNVLIIPEHATTSTYSAAAPYGQWLTYNYTGTPGSPATTLATYPGAFSVIYPADGNTAADQAPTTASIARGDIILFRGWFNDSYNSTMLSMYQQAVPSVPAAPTGPSTIAGDHRVTLTWNAVTGTGIYGTGVYNVKRATTHNGPYTTIAYGLFGPGFVDTTAVNNTHYFYVVSAVNGRGESANSVEVSATPVPSPTVAAPATSSPMTVSAKTANLSVLGADQGGESALSYLWTSVSIPANAPPATYSLNNSNAAKNTLATFHQAGSYTFTVTITNGANLSTTSSVTVIVKQTVMTMSVSPAKASIAANGTLQYSVLARDQFSNRIASPAVVWLANAGGAFNASGLFTAGNTLGTYAVTAAVGSVHAITKVTIVAAPVIALPVTPVVSPPAPTNLFSNDPIPETTAGPALMGPIISTPSHAVVLYSPLPRLSLATIKPKHPPAHPLPVIRPKPSRKKR
jgi:hypothetical protein